MGMVCEKCEKKLKRVVCPEVYADPTKPKQRVFNENKLLTSRRQGSVRSVAAPTPSATTRNRTSSTSKSAGKDDFNPYARKCKICTGGISLQGAYYCQDCAYSKGICSMCGKKVLDTSSYKQSTV